MPDAATRFDRMTAIPATNYEGTCWPFTGHHDRNGYGRFRWNGRTGFAHRFAYERDHGPTSLNVLHRCDNPSCVRPSHLFAGSQADNVADMIGKGRGRCGVNPHRGSAVANSKLTEEQVALVKAAAVSRRHGDVTRIARELGVQKTTISRIMRGTAWAHVQ